MSVRGLRYCVVIDSRTTTGLEPKVLVIIDFPWSRRTSLSTKFPTPSFSTGYSMVCYSFVSSLVLLPGFLVSWVELPQGDLFRHYYLRRFI